LNDALSRECDFGADAEKLATLKVENVTFL